MQTFRRRIGRIRSKSFLSIALASACSMLGCTMHPAPLPADARTNPAPFLIVTLNSVPGGLRTAPGSSAPRYDGAGPYDVSAETRNAVHALERDYGLREVSAWPIPALHVHCVVFRVPPTQTPSSAIARLLRDARVQSVQILNQFESQGETANIR
jgi:hypothetical protein